MTLAAALAAFREYFLARVPADRAKLIQTYIDRSRDDHVAANALRAGDRAPAFTLRNQNGIEVALAERSMRGPVILVFYRGGWCPYCNLELRAYQRLLPEIETAGGTLLAISPQQPDASLSTAEKNALAFDVLSDTGSRMAKAFGIAYTLPEPLRALYTQIGHALPEINADDSWTLPVPATFVLDRNGIVTLAHVDVDYRVRLEPQAALDEVRRVVANERASREAA